MREIVGAEGPGIGAQTVFPVWVTELNPAQGKLSRTCKHQQLRGGPCARDVGSVCGHRTFLPLPVLWCRPSDHSVNTASSLIPWSLDVETEREGREDAMFRWSKKPGFKFLS